MASPRREDADVPTTTALSASRSATTMLRRNTLWIFTIHSQIRPAWTPRRTHCSTSSGWPRVCRARLSRAYTVASSPEREGQAQAREHRLRWQGVIVSKDDVSDLAVIDGAGRETRGTGSAKTLVTSDRLASESTSRGHDRTDGYRQGPRSADASWKRMRDESSTNSPPTSRSDGRKP